MESEPAPEQPDDDELLPDDEEGEAEEVHARDLKQLARFFRPFAHPYRRLFLGLGLFLLLETVFNLSFPLATQYLVDEGLLRHNARVLVAILIFLAVAAVSVTVLGLGCDFLAARIFSGMVRDVRQRLFDHLQTLSLPFYSRAQAGSLLSRFSGDLVALEGALVALIPWLVLPLIEVIYSTVLMFYFNVWLALLGLLVFPMILWAPRLFATRAFALSYDKRRSEAQVLSAVQENVAAQPVVKAFGLESRARADFDRRGAAWLRLAFRFNLLSFLVERSAHTGVYLVHLLVFGVGAYWAFTGELTIGTLVAFEGMFLSMGYSLTYVTQFVPTLAQAAGSVRHLDDLFAERPQVVDAPDALAAPRLEKEIVFDRVSFTYPGGRFRLRKLSVRIPCGSQVAFVGASGSGKSTVLHLLLRFFDPGRGVIGLDGRDLRTLTQASVRAQIGIVFQDSFLFNTTIGENIRLGRPEATPEQVEAAARAAEIHDFIAALPHGYETVVGERGSQLSGGQRQRLAIARALVRDPALLILDEATSALDYATEAAVLDTLRKIAQGRTVIHVTHRLTSVIDADHIVLLDHGRVREEGTHEELLARNGSYAGLWWKQTKRSRLPSRVSVDSPVPLPENGTTTA